VIPPGYQPADTERRHPTPSGQAWPGRSPFAVDRQRLGRTAAIRALAGKTQALDPDEGPAPRSRLTHSYEVAHIAHAIGVPLGADPHLLDTVALAHDLGHPPFGHAGEAALDTLTADTGGFSANAHTFWLLTHLPALNLTRATLDAACKYPWTRRDDRRYSITSSTTDAFTWTRLPAPPGAGRCIEADIVDWADDIANAVGDLDDALHAGLLPVPALTDPDHRAVLARLAADRLTTQPADQILDAADQITATPLVSAVLRGEAAPAGTAPGDATLALLSETLLHRFIEQTVAATRTAFGAGPLTRYHATLTIPPAITAEVAWLKAIILHHVLRDPARRARRARQRDLLTDLAHTLHHTPADHLPPAHHTRWAAATDDHARLHTVVAYLAELTEDQTVELHRRTTAA